MTRDRTGHSALFAFRCDLARVGIAGVAHEPSVIAIAVYRLGTAILRAKQPARKVLWLLYLPVYYFARLATGIDLPPQAEIGPGLRIHHFGSIIIHPRVKIGRNFTLRHGVTIGVTSAHGAAPAIGDDVFIGAHAQILGPISVGDRARVGALALVIRDVLPDQTVVAPAAVPLDSDRTHSDA